jgi:uncharacterized membrane protein YhaH (DUF805 family)
MTDPHDPAGMAKPRGMFWWLGGRAGRREYAVSVALLFGVGFALSYAAPIVGDGLSAVLIFTQIRRLHDFNRSGWWSAAATLAPLIPAIPLMMMSGQEDLGLAVGVLVELALIIVIGGDPGLARRQPLRAAAAVHRPPRPDRALTPLTEILWRPGGPRH